MNRYCLHRFLLFVFALASATAMAQPAADYYTASTLDGKYGRDLELALKAIVNPHTQKTYSELWSCFPTTDAGPADSIPSGYTKTDLVYDMYAWMSQFPKFYSDGDHTQTGGINREHCVPNSWWGGESGNGVAYTDLHHLVPSDGCANSAKGNWPLGEYEDGMTLNFPKATKTNSSNVTYVYEDANSHSTSSHCLSNASHVWKVSDSSSFGGASEVFEPADEYKGDFARMYLYVVCAYEGELTWKVNYMFTNGSDGYTTILDWAKALLLKWCRQDPVSDKERARNNAVFGIQNNRNPFIDYPEFVEYIWGDKSTTAFSLSNAVSAYSDEYKGGGGTTDPTDPDTPTDPTDPEEPTSYSTGLIMNATLGETFRGMTLTTDSDGTITYSSSNTGVATVDANTGEISLVGAGTTIITATTAATLNNTASTSSYTIVVK